MKKKFPAVLMMLHVLVLGVLIPTYLLIDRKNAVLNALILSVVALILICVIYTIIYSKNSMRRISKMNQHLESSAAEFMNSLPAPVAVIDESRQFVWYNQIFAEKIGLGQDVYGLELEGFVKIDMNMLLKEGSAICPMNGSIYNVTAEKFDKNDMSFLVLYFHDDTSYYTVRKRMEESHPNVVIINIDNYDDIMQNAKESEKAQASVETEKLIENFMSKTNGFIKKTSSNTFYAIIENHHINEIIDSKFKILDAARNIKISGKYSLTFSIGVGQGASSLAESEKFARQCLDMALGRGGDQAVVKTDNGYRFFGGVSNGVEKRSRSKTRIIANALQDLIMNSDKIFIMGHRFGDLDSVGAACGLAGAISLVGKPVYIAVDRTKNLASNLIDIVDEETEGELFITPSEAEGMIAQNDLLIIVDTHNKDYVESRSLYEKAKNVVVIDHHRKNVNFIDNAVIFHHEPYASSASEMVTELLEYFNYDGDEKLRNCHADALLAGIMLDTKNFVMRTGVRTFEAAAFLKKLGADTVAVKLLFSHSIDSYRRKTQIVASAKIHNNCAIAAADFKSDDIRLVAPQAADELLGITDVDASFVIYKTGSTLNISARSLGALNVQVIMEQLGGGGHQTMAATQLEGTSVEDAVKSLIYAIDEYRKNAENSQ
ncbi:DHH family phosphoesterase [Ruminococcus flavefaciens]|uniref:DHH family phosphoesterase n=1 Tax=Ruminococcus flavefaciens TaxID=1265 RepID=UPI0013DBE3F7|nr:DHH family phosphoesterase [Ruminococcus flavefaciens]